MEKVVLIISLTVLWIGLIDGNQKTSTGAEAIPSDSNEAGSDKISFVFENSDSPNLSSHNNKSYVSNKAKRAVPYNNTISLNNNKRFNTNNWQTQFSNLPNRPVQKPIYTNTNYLNRKTSFVPFGNPYNVSTNGSFKPPFRTTTQYVSKYTPYEPQHRPNSYEKSSYDTLEPIHPLVGAIIFFLGLICIGIYLLFNKCRCDDLMSEVTIETIEYGNERVTRY